MLQVPRSGLGLTERSVPAELVVTTTPLAGDGSQRHVTWIAGPALLLLRRLGARSQADTFWLLFDAQARRPLFCMLGPCDGMAMRGVQTVALGMPQASWLALGVPPQILGAHVLPGPGVMAPLEASGSLCEQLLASLIGAVLSAPAQASASHAVVAELAAETAVSLVALYLGRGADATPGLPATSRAGQVIQHLERHYRNSALSAGAVADELGVTPRYVHAVMARAGLRFSDKLLEIRLEAARRLILASGSGTRSIGDIAFDCGFNSQSYFNRMFRARYGCSPRELRRVKRFAQVPHGNDCLS